ncbi:MAG: hypothetical protein R2867_36475 [Caldilineaceae bacterium]
MDGSKTVTANFDEILTLTVNVVGQGTVAKDPDKATYEKGDQVGLTATPAAGWKFVGWSGDLTATNATTTILMNTGKNVTATFSRIELA